MQPGVLNKMWWLGPQAEEGVILFLGEQQGWS